VSYGRVKDWLVLFSEFAETAEYRHLLNIADRRVFFDELAEVNEDEAEVYDVSVPDTHAFVGNGLINHNTTNGPSTDTVEDVEGLYTLAYDLGCKGITYYRQGSRDAVLEAVKEEKPEAEVPAPAPVAAPVPLAPKKRPEVLSGQTRQVRAPEGKVNITLNCDPDTGALFEVFINLGKAGSDIAAMAEALGRLISFNLQMPSPMSQTDRTREMIDQLRGIGGSRTVGFGPNQVKLLPDGVGLALGKYVEAATRTPLPGARPQGEQPLVAGGSQEEDAAKTAIPTGAFCPSCRNATMVRIEGCRKCETRGHSEC
ncbi:MAG: hypothetical protein M3P51_10300, partial [Chloroflexota bacterium]|nr:hypothetical protein [Chloroflexota bacterium]